MTNERAVESGDTARTWTALVLDDDPMIRSEIGEFLSEMDYRIRYCGDFIGAMEEMDFDNDVTVIVADYHLMGDQKHNLNGMNFIDCCRMRFPGRDIRYFLMSGDRAPLSDNKEDKQVTMISKVTAVEQLTEHLASLCACTPPNPFQPRYAP